MTNLEETSGPAASPEVAQRWLPALLLLFVGSGCAALIYEVVWFQLLQLSIGSSAVSLGVLLGIFMGGMCLGSLLLPRYLNPSQHPLRVYALLELGHRRLRRDRAVCGADRRRSTRRSPAPDRPTCSSGRSSPASACCRRRC